MINNNKFIIFYTNNVHILLVVYCKLRLDKEHLKCLHYHNYEKFLFLNNLSEQLENLYCDPLMCITSFLVVLIIISSLLLYDIKDRYSKIFEKGR